MAAPRKIAKERRKRKERILKQQKEALWHGTDLRQMLEWGCPALPQGNLCSVGEGPQGVRTPEAPETYDCTPSHPFGRW